MNHSTTPRKDIDPAAASLDRAVVCDLSHECPDLPTSSFDVVFSHVVLEHVRRPWVAVDTIARVTKKGGLSLHVVPFLHRFETSRLPYAYLYPTPEINLS
jgi:ubiquinone/menaquinone biosynthesis C-methylase UbiE